MATRGERKEEERRSHIKVKMATAENVCNVEAGHTTHTTLVAELTTTALNSCLTAPSLYVSSAGTHPENGCGEPLPTEGRELVGESLDIGTTGLEGRADPPQPHGQPTQEGDQETGSAINSRWSGPIGTEPGSCGKSTMGCKMDYKSKCFGEDGSNATLPCVAALHKGPVVSSKESWGGGQKEKATGGERLGSVEREDTFETSPGSQTPTEEQTSLYEATSLSLTQPEAEVVSMAATDRSAASSMRPHSPTRPNHLCVAPANGGEGEGEGEEEGAMFVQGEEERTPDGGRVREFVGHPYRSALMNNGEVVTPERVPTPPDTVFGIYFPLEPYRRQFYVDNNHPPLSRFLSLDGSTPSLTLRQNSAPAQGLADQFTYRDNNGRLVSHSTHRPYSPTRSL